MPTYGAMWPKYSKQWDAMQRERLSMAKEAAERIIANKTRYQIVEAKTGVPWYWIGPTHYREADLDFTTQLAQGDPLDKISTHVPRGQGPYFGDDAWERAALIALEDHGLTKVIDWRLEKLLYWWESYNGWGYFNHGVPSAYVWAGTSIYDSGMYVSDNNWSSIAKDRRVGCAAILKCLAETDPSIVLVRETPDKPETQMPEPIPYHPPPLQVPQIDYDALAEKIVGRMQKPMAGILSTLLPGLAAQSPLIGIGIFLLQQYAASAGVMGTLSGPTATPTAQNVGTTAGAIFIGGLVNMLRQFLQRQPETPS